MKKYKTIIILGVIGLILIGSVIFCVLSLKPVSSSTDVVTFVVESGTNKIEIIDNLKKANVIRNKYVALAYVFFTPNANLQAGTYLIDRADSTGEIIRQIANGITKEVPVTVQVRFIEGKRFTDYAKLISNNFAIEYDEIIATCADKDFLNELIYEYWFLDDSILDKNIYYPLEGYLFPDTYEFYQNASIKDIVRKMLSELEAKLEPLKKEINASKYNVHELLSMASIIEKEALNEKDRKMVSQVIYKRLNVNMTLGMDVTTYYAVQKDLKEGLTAKDFATYNPYNTRHPQVHGLPVGPICSPSLESIKASLNPSDTDYTYFVADVETGKVYFASTYNEFAEYCKMLGLGV